MFYLRHVAILSALTSAVTSRPTYTRRQTSTLAVTGATEGGVQSRLEVHDLQNNADQWNIYLLALQSFQAVDSSDPMSWYQISGIHGQPYVAWDGAEMCDNCTLTGYCTHMSTLFTTWHRPYLALFEQALQTHALTVAHTFSGDDQSRYVDAATTLRMPYWDWALQPADGKDPFPQMFTDQTVTVNTPSGQQNITNPLLEYNFNGADHSFMPNSGSDVTTRGPPMGANDRQQLRSDLWTALTSQTSYDAFSTSSLLPGTNNYNAMSLEGVHDHVHNLIGGGMGDPETAAFDPVFWLHHAMVDHSFAVWQAANPDVWMQGWDEVGQTYTYASGAYEDSQSPLAPFHSDTNGDFWISDTVRETTTFNYQYADLASGESAADIMNSLYRDNQTPISKRSVMSDVLHNSGAVSDYVRDGIGSPLPNVTQEEYVANIEADTMGTEGSFTVFLFDGHVDDSNPSGWRTEQYLVGSHGFFTSQTAMGNGSALANAGVSMTGALLADVDAGRLRNMSNVEVSYYLTASLRWRVQLLNGTVVPATAIPGLSINIVTADVQLPSSNGQMPVWSAWRPLVKIL